MHEDGSMGIGFIAGIAVSVAVALCINGCEVDPEDVEKNVAIVEFTHSTKPETIEKVISVNTSGEDCQIKYFEGTTKCTKTYKSKTVRNVTFKEGK